MHITRPTPAPAVRSQRRRLYSIILFLTIMILVLICRLVNLTIINRNFLRTQGDARTLRTITIPAHRGMILDRNAEPLAISVPVAAVWINPAEFNVSRQTLNILSTLLNLPPQIIQQRINHNRTKAFIYLKRSISLDLAAKIKALKLPGLFLQTEYHRYYPAGAAAAHVLGLTNVDDKGQEGLELAYNDWLEGIPGLKKVVKDRLGHIIAGMGTLRSPRPGQNLQLSIDNRLQHAAYHELKTGIKNYQANSGSTVVLDVNTGEILAMANWPSYNPNDRSTLRRASYRNRAVTDLFEPASSIKSFSMVSILASGQFKPTSQVDTSPGWLIVSGKPVRDARNYGLIDLTTILRVSSNVGISKLVLSLPPENLWNTLHKVGFGESTQSGFPGERTGTLQSFKVWDPFVLATLSFGYGLSATALQLAQAYAVLANSGFKVPVTFLKVSEPVAGGQQVLDKHVSGEVLRMLESALINGTPLAHVPGYRVTGKTGTARIVGEHGYDKHHYNSFFVGIAPASRPRLVVVVILHNPKGQLYYGRQTAAPIFSRIMSHALRLLHIPPDDHHTTQTAHQG